MMQQGKSSSILGLFSQQWFLNKIVQDEYSSDDYTKSQKEELLIALIVSAMQYKRTS